MSREESTRRVNDQTLVVCMIEETEAVENLDDILTVPGVDVLHVASGDLGQSMGNPGAAEVRRLMSQTVPRIKAGGKLAGVGGNSPEDAAGVGGVHQARREFCNHIGLGTAAPGRGGLSGAVAGGAWRVAYRAGALTRTEET